MFIKMGHKIMKSLLNILMIFAFFITVSCQQSMNKQNLDQQAMDKYNKLTPEEEKVIIYKGTEQPFTGKYDELFDKGTYYCKQCGSPLFRSEDKFDSGCGWPSFDDEIKGAVKRTPDADGRRTEITCEVCGAHLGHVFTGEHFTQKNTRYCVNSISMNFVPDSDTTALQRAIFAGGCFWGVEYYFRQAPGVVSAKVGYTGGHKEHPTYKEVCAGKTGHLEAVEVTYDPNKTTYEALAKLFFDIHDPTQADGQGPDKGEQYHSAVFYTDLKQKEVDDKLINDLKQKGYNVTTEVRREEVFWTAEDYHQDYYAKTGGVPYCHTFVERVK
jgi:peptide methionine sulfoxide reductase msrA/msrB